MVQKGRCPRLRGSGLGTLCAGSEGHASTVNSSRGDNGSLSYGERGSGKIISFLRRVVPAHRFLMLCQVFPGSCSLSHPNAPPDEVMALLHPDLQQGGLEVRGAHSTRQGNGQTRCLPALPPSEPPSRASSPPRPCRSSSPAHPASLSLPPGQSGTSDGCPADRKLRTEFRLKEPAEIHLTSPEACRRASTQPGSLCVQAHVNNGPRQNLV